MIYESNRMEMDRIDFDVIDFVINLLRWNLKGGMRYDEISFDSDRISSETDQLRYESLVMSACMETQSNIFPSKSNR